jgi:hypothetical protein
MAKVTAIVWAWPSSGRYPLLSLFGSPAPNRATDRRSSRRGLPRETAGRPVWSAAARHRQRRILRRTKVLLARSSASQHATDVRRSMQANSKEDEKELLRLLGDLKREFGVPDRYKFEGRPRRERPPPVCPCRVGAPDPSLARAALIQVVGVACVMMTCIFCRSPLRLALRENREN